ncbi:MAG: MarR family transcriptional regulator [Alphaproteobacteria bacterium]|nr:MarR family transcriptional regulator [Alphaproteobacteria bacterium]
MTQPDDTYRLEEQVGFLLRKAHQRATAVFQDVIGDPTVTPTQYAALIKLLDEGPLSQNHLGRLTAMDPATIQGVLRRLAARRFIALKSDPADRRRKTAALTAKGRALVERLRRNGQAVSAAVLQPLDETERRSFLALLGRLG